MGGQIALALVLLFLVAYLSYQAGHKLGYRKAESDRMSLEFEIQKRRVEDSIRRTAERMGR